MRMNIIKCIPLPVVVAYQTFPPSLKVSKDLPIVIGYALWICQWIRIWIVKWRMEVESLMLLKSPNPYLSVPTPNPYSTNTLLFL